MLKENIISWEFAKKLRKIGLIEDDKETIMIFVDFQFVKRLDGIFIQKDDKKDKKDNDDKGIQMIEKEEMVQRQKIIKLN